MTTLKTLDDIIASDELGLLNIDGDISIFKQTHVTFNSKSKKKVETIERRKSMKPDAFAPYETLFKNVHYDLKQKNRAVVAFNNPSQNLKVGYFYLVNGLLALLESVDSKGRAYIVFENQTDSKMLLDSFAHAIYESGARMITNNF